MITITVTEKQLKTIEGALENYIEALQDDYEHNSVQRDELGRASSALDTVRNQGTWAIVDGLNQRIN